MASLLKIDVSPRGDASYSRQFGDTFLAGFQAAHPGSTVVTRDLAKDQPTFLDVQWIGGAFSPPDQLTDAHKAALKLSDDIIAEVQAAGNENKRPVEKALLAKKPKTRVRDRGEEVRRDGVRDDADAGAECGKVVGEAIGRELRDGVDHVGAGGEPAEQQRPLQALSPEGGVLEVSALLEVGGIVNGDDQTGSGDGNVGLASAEDDVGFGPEGLRLGGVEREPARLLARGLGREGVVAKALPGLADQRQDALLIAGVGEDAKLDVRTLGKVLGQLARYPAGAGGGVDVAQMDVGEQVQRTGRSGHGMVRGCVQESPVLRASQWQILGEFMRHAIASGVPSERTRR